MTQGRWESHQHKTAREWSCLSGSCSPERRAGGVLSSLLIQLKACTDPAPALLQRALWTLSVPEEKRAFNSTGANVGCSRSWGGGPHPAGSRIAWQWLWLPWRARQDQGLCLYAARSNSFLPGAGVQHLHGSFCKAAITACTSVPAFLRGM